MYRCNTPPNENILDSYSVVADITTPTFILRMDLTPLAKGTYLIEAVFEKEKITKRIVID